MVIEESSVVAAASAAAKFWSERGGFHAEIIDTQKVGQVHFSWSGSPQTLRDLMPALSQYLLNAAKPITANMEKRGGGVLDIKLKDMTDKLDDYYQLMVTFDTRDSMGANFINSVLEEFGHSLRQFMLEQLQLSTEERQVEIIMAILSNYTPPDCVVKTW